MKVIVLQLANDEVCVCNRCTNPAGDGGAGDYKRMIQAMRETWASEAVDGVEVYYIYGHREGISFPENSKIIKSKERYWPDGSAGDGFAPKDVEQKRAPFAIGDCIYSDTPEGRENLYYKTIDGFQWLIENKEFDYIMRTSAGTYVDLKILKNYLENFGIQDNLYFGHPNAYDNSHAPPSQPRTVKYGSGCGFIVSRNLIEEMVKNRNNIEFVRSRYASATIADDVTIGKYLINDLGIPMINYYKSEYRSVAQITSRVKNEMVCYFCHTIDPDMLYTTHKMKKL